MNTIQNTELLNELNVGLKPEPSEASNELGQEEFLELMIAQLKNQDPTKPMDGQEYLGQLAQFSSVQGLQELNAAVQDLAQHVQSSSALQASSLVNQNVLIASEKGYLGEAEPLQGAVKLTENVKDLTLGIYDMSGQEVHRLSLGDRSMGDVNFSWDGLDSQGVQRPMGIYHIKAEGIVDGQASNFATQLQARVESVTLGQGGQGVTLNLAGLGRRDLSDVQEIF
jgi:flagellar basal-body rod modification protein FlgD